MMIINYQSLSKAQDSFGRQFAADELFDLVEAFEDRLTAAS